MTTMPDPNEWSDEELLRWGRRALREIDDAPPRLVHAALSIWREPRPLHRLLAALRFDSRTPQPALRSAGTAERHLLFAAGGHDIDLRIAPGAAADDGPRFDLSGQVLGPAEFGSLHLADPAGIRPPQLAALDDMGGFAISGITPGRWHATLRLDADEVELPPLDIGS